MGTTIEFTNISAPQEAIARHLYNTLSNDANKLEKNFKLLVTQANEIISKCNAIHNSLSKKESAASDYIKERMMSLKSPLEDLLKEVTNIATESSLEAKSRQYHEVYY